MASEGEKTAQVKLMLLQKICNPCFHWELCLGRTRTIETVTCRGLSSLMKLLVRSVHHRKSKQTLLVT